MLVNGVETEALLDSGSTTTLIDVNWAEACSIKWGPLKDGRRWRGPSGHLLKPVGCAKVELIIGQAVVEHEIVVIDGLIHSFILGVDVLATHKFRIDYEHLTLHFKDQSIPIRAKYWNLSAPVTANLATTVPARSERRIWLRGPQNIGEQVLVENRLDQLNCAIVEGLHAIDDRRTFIVRIVNRSRVPVSIEPGDVVCCVSSVELAGHIPMHLEQISSSEEPEVVATIEEEAFTPSLIANIDRTNMSEEIARHYSALLDDNADIFSKNDNDIGLSEFMHDIHLADSTPFKSRAYRIPISQQTITEEHVDNMLKMGIIRPSASDHSSPIVLVKKSDGSIRFCIDYRKLNAATIKDHYPTPLIEERLNSVFGSSVFSDIDLTSGYWQFKMAESATHLTAFICHLGLFEFVRMPFGLCNAGATFQRSMERMLKGLKFASAYIDDIIVHSKSHEEHLSHLELVFARLRQAKLKIKLRKCHFGCRETKFLGYVISAEGVRMNSAKIEAIKDYPRPRSAREARKWNGLTSQYRQFVENYTTVNDPLQQAALLFTRDPKTKKRVKAKFEWTAECEAAFARMKQLLTEEPITLVHPDTSKRFRLITDASKVGLGAVLVQADKDGVERVVCFASRVLLQAERNYTTGERELLAVKWAVRKFRCYLYGVCFDVYTDHKPLCHIKTSQNPSDRMLKWILELEEYNASYFYRPGKLNVQADILSRIAEGPDDDTPIQWYPRCKPVSVLEAEQAKLLTDRPVLYGNSDEDEETVLALSEFDERQYSIEPDNINKRLLTEAQWQDKQIQTLLKRYEKGETSRELHNFKQDEQGTLYLHDKTYLTWRVVVPAIYVKHILQGCHDDIGGAHLGRTKTLNKVAQRFYWFGMARDVQNWVASCSTCNARKQNRMVGLPKQQPLPTVSMLFDRLSMDFVGPLPTTKNGNRYSLVLVDYATRWPEAFATKDMKATTVASILVDEIMCRHGAPVEILSDQAQDFVAEVVKEVCAFMRAKKIQGAPYHPQTNGLCERFNGTLCEALYSYCRRNQATWDEMLPIALFGCRIAVQTSTGFSPASLLYGRELRLPLDVDLYMPKLQHTKSLKRNWQRGQIGVADQAAKNKKRHDTTIRHEPHAYRVGDRVRLRIHVLQPGVSSKFSEKWSETCEVAQVLRNNIGVMQNGRIKLVNNMHVKPAEVVRSALV